MNDGSSEGAVGGGVWGVAWADLLSSWADLLSF